jgi:2-polyprenyl-3-methyl-5-hydroxy-6-metoxy-1,4-benzoquinol methylase
MQKRHSDNNLYFEEQTVSTRKYVIPYIEQVCEINKNTAVLEIGCGQGGNLLPFLEKGCNCIGVDICREKILMGQDFFKNHQYSDKIELIYEGIYEIDPEIFQKFDIIILRDVIEHLPDHVQLMKLMKSYLKEDGIVFFAFPPWRMPFGGHQQVLQNKILSKLPFYHILPNPVFRWMLKLGKTDENTIKGMVELKQTSISIAKFRKIVKQNGYEFVKTTDWFINPNYEIKFNLKHRKLYFFNKIPYFRDFFTTSYYAIIRQKTGI